MLKMPPLNESMLPYRDKYQGESAVLYATGKTLYSYVPTNNDRLAKVRLGVNRAIFAPNLHLTHWFFGDRYDATVKAAHNFPGVEKFIHNGHYKKEEAHRLGAVYYYISPSQVQFHKDIHNHVMWNRSIVFSAMQFLLYSGVTHVKLVGCDVDYSSGSWQHPAAPLVYYRSNAVDGVLLAGWHRLKLFLDRDYPHVRVEILRPILLRGVFPEAEERLGPSKIF